MYDLEVSKAVRKIKDTGAELVCVQLPDGLKPRAKEIQLTIEDQTDAQVVLWGGTCFGSCDTPFYIDRFGFDLLIAWGHSPWR